MVAFSFIQVGGKNDQQTFSNAGKRFTRGVYLD
jgi:hypothetical protein